jgi:transposase
LARIGRIFALEEAWRSDPPDVILRMRRQHLRPHLEAFFAWAEGEYQRVRDQRGLLRSALGYAVRQKDALMRVLEDGRLVLENNRSERELRRIAVGRKGWLFIGSHDHGEAAGHIFSLVASARLHRLDPEGYLRDLFRVLAHWPRDRYLELAPKYWAQTRTRLDTAELAAEIGPLTVPPPLPAAEGEQVAAD